MLLILIALIILSSLFLYFYRPFSNMLEHYNDQSGQLCITCKDKKFNPCIACFNCVWCEDEFGNSGCIGGDRHGPYNNERCSKWTSGDPYVDMERRNNNYVCPFNAPVNRKINHPRGIL